jgi:hypothetical protein
MNTRHLSRGLATLILSSFIVLSVNGMSNSVASPQTPEIKDFYDDFAGSSLRPEWTIVNQDANRWALVDSEYLLLLANDNKNKFCYKGAVTDRYEFTVKIVLPRPLNKWDVFVSSIAKDDGEGLELIASTYASASTDWTFAKTVGDAEDKKAKTEFETTTKSSGAYYVRIRKIGVEYTGFISNDRHDWTEIGTHYFPRLAATPCFCVKRGYNYGSTPESVVMVDFAELHALR